MSDSSHGLKWRLLYILDFVSGAKLLSVDDRKADDITMKNTIRRRMLVTIVIPFLFIFVMLSIYIVQSAFTEATDHAMTEIQGLTQINGANMEGKLDSVRISVMSADNILESVNPQAEDARKQCDDAVISMFENESIYNSWLAYEPLAFDGRDLEFKTDYPGAPSGRFIRSYLNEDNEIIVAPDMDERTLDDRVLSPWYVIPRDTGELYIDFDNSNENLYDYGFGNDSKFTLSIVSPLQRDGKVIGCVGADVLFDNMVISLGEEAQATVAIFYPDGRIFYAPDVKYADESIDTLRFSKAKEIRRALEGNTDLMLENEYSVFLEAYAYTYFYPVYSEKFGESLFLYVAIPRSRVFGAALSMLLPLALSLLATLLVLTVLMFYVLNSVSKPIKALTLAADSISQGNLETEIAIVSGGTDEIGVLSRSLHRMVEQFRVDIIMQERAAEKLNIYSRLTQSMRSAQSPQDAFDSVSSFLSMHFDAENVTIVLDILGRVRIASVYDKELGQKKIDMSSESDFIYHSKICSLLADKDIVFLNEFALSQQKISFMPDTTKSACIIPLRTDNHLTGYIIFENENEKGSYYSDDTTLLYTAKVISETMPEQLLMLSKGTAKAKTPALSTDLPIIIHADVPDKTPSGLHVTAEPVKIFEKPQPEQEIIYDSPVIEAAKAIDGLNADSALSALGHLQPLYEKSLLLFNSMMPDTVNKLDSLVENDMPAFTIEVHGAKSALANIGASNLAQAAAELEQAAQREDSYYCKEHYPSFKNKLLKLTAQLDAVFKENGKSKQSGDESELLLSLLRAKEACEGLDPLLAKKIIEPCLQLMYSGKVDDLLEELARSLDLFDCDKALELIDALYKEVQK